MEEKIRKGMDLSLNLVMRSIAWGDESSAFFYGRILARHALLLIDLKPEVYHYPDFNHRRIDSLIIDHKMLAANDRG